MTSGTFPAGRSRGPLGAARRFVTADVRAALVPWVVARLLVFGSLALARFAFDEVGAPPRPVQLGQGLFAWDGAFYRAIAEHGYDAVQEPGLRFFPLYPLLGRALGVVLLDHTAVALIVLSNVSALLFGALLHRLTLRETADARAAARAAWLAALFPPAVVLVMGYAEAISMMLAAATFLALRRRRWPAAIVAGFLAGLCRPLGALLVVPAAVEGLRGWGRQAPGERISRVAAVVAPVAGMATYLVWVEVVYGDGLLPLRLQGDPQRRGGFVFPLDRVVDAWRDLFGGDRFGSGLHGVWAVIFIALLVVVIRRLPAAYGAYAGASLLVLLSARNLDSFERYAMSTFPLVLAAALLTGRGETERAVLVLSAAGLVGYAVLGFLGIWVP